MLAYILLFPGRGLAPDRFRSSGSGDEPTFVKDYKHIHLLAPPPSNSHSNRRNLSFSPQFQRKAIPMRPPVPQVVHAIVLV